LPSWKRVITSGSAAALSSLLLTDGLEVTGSVQITGSLGLIGPLAVSSSQDSYVIGSGNVGIGTTSPGYMFDVLSTDGPTTARFANNDGEDTLVRIIAGNYNTELDARLFIGETDTYGMTFEYDGVANIGYIGMNDNVDPTGAYSKRIAMPRSTADTYFPAGNVGIGTTSPSHKLSVFGGDAIFTQYIGTGNGSSFTIVNSTTTSNGTALQASYFGSGGYGPLKFEVGGSERMRITSNGNVGIGTTSPGNNLEVRGVAGGNHFVVGSTGYDLLKVAGSSITMQPYPAGSGTDGIYIKAYDSGYALRDVIRVINASAATSPHLLLQPSGGNVGIGTTSPTAKLHIAMPDVASAANPVTGSGWSEYFWNQGSAPSDATRVLLLDTTSNTASSRVLGIGFAPGYTGHQNWQ
jgi:hypothetical protein